MAMVIVMFKWSRTNFCKVLMQFITAPFSSKPICPGCEFSTRKKERLKIEDAIFV